LPDGTTVNDKILAANQAVPYEGGKRVWTKSRWTPTL
jgi:hypothetical protein